MCTFERPQSYLRELTAAHCRFPNSKDKKIICTQRADRCLKNKNEFFRRGQTVVFKRKIEREKESSYMCKRNKRNRKGVLKQKNICLV